MTYDDVEEAKRRVEYERAIELKRLRDKEKVLQEENLEKILKKQKEQAIKHSLDQYKEKHREILDIQSQPIRNYLSNNVAEILADGLAEICRTQPEDPVDALAAYLFKHSLRVPEPNPFSF